MNPPASCKQPPSSHPHGRHSTSCCRTQASSSLLFVHTEQTSLAPAANETEGPAGTMLSSMLEDGRNNLLHTPTLPKLETTTQTTTVSHNSDDPAFPPQASPRIIFGTAALGKAENPFELLDAAYKSGFHRFDLARTYGGGVSELIFGAWMHDRGIERTDVEIITKGGMGSDKYGNPDRPLLTRDVLQMEVNTSLEALQTDYVDTYMFHRDDPRIDVSQFVVWANELLQDGKCRQWGVSNWSFERFQQAFYFSQQNGLEPPRANSPQFSLAIPRGEVWPTTQSISGPQYVEQIEWYEKNDVELLCWEVLAKGFMAKPHLWCQDSIDPSFLLGALAEIGSDEWRLQRIQKAYCYDLNYHRRRVAVQLARDHGCKLSQIATLYILSRGNHVSVIFGSNNLDHLADMVDISTLGKDRAMMSRLDRLLTAASSLSPSSSSSPSSRTYPKNQELWSMVGDDDC